MARPVLAPRRESSRRAWASPSMRRRTGSGAAPRTASRSSVADRGGVSAPRCAGTSARPSAWSARVARPKAAMAMANPWSKSSPSGVSPGPRPTSRAAAEVAERCSRAATARTRSAIASAPLRSRPPSRAATRASVAVSTPVEPAGSSHRPTRATASGPPRNGGSRGSAGTTAPAPDRTPLGSRGTPSPQVVTTTRPRVRCAACPGRASSGDAPCAASHASAGSVAAREHRLNA